MFFNFVAELVCSIWSIKPCILSSIHNLLLLKGYWSDQHSVILWPSANEFSEKASSISTQLSWRGTDHLSGVICCPQSHEDTKLFKNWLFSFQVLCGHVCSTGLGLRTHGGVLSVVKPPLSTVGSGFASRWVPILASGMLCGHGKVFYLLCFSSCGSGRKGWSLLAMG